MKKTQDYKKEKKTVDFLEEVLKCDSLSELLDFAEENMSDGDVKIDWTKIPVEKTGINIFDIDSMEEGVGK